jgi:hypothetical protein
MEAVNPDRAGSAICRHIRRVNDLCACACLHYIRRAKLYYLGLAEMPARSNRIA